MEVSAHAQHWGSIGDDCLEQFYAEKQAEWESMPQLTSNACLGHWMGERHTGAHALVIPVYVAEQLSLTLEILPLLYEPSIANHLLDPSDTPSLRISHITCIWPDTSRMTCYWNRSLVAPVRPGTSNMADNTANIKDDSSEHERPKPLPCEVWSAEPREGR